MKNKILFLVIGTFLLFSIMQLSASPLQIAGSYIQNGTVDFYQMNETSGSMLDILSNVNGANSGAVQGVHFSGSNFLGYSFGGSAQVVLSNMPVSKAGTVFFWFQLNSTANSNLVYQSAGGVSGLNCQVFSDNLYCSIDGGGSFVHSSVALSTGLPYFAALTYDNSSTVNLYLNSTTVADTQANSKGGITQDLYVGSGGSANYFTGYISLLGFKSYPINSSEVGDLLNIGATGWGNLSGGGGSTPSSSINVTLISPANNTVTTSLSNSFTAGILSNQSLTNATFSIFYANGTLLYSNIIYNTSLAMQNIWVADKGNEVVQKWNTTLNNQVAYGFNEYSSLPAGSYKMAADKYNNLWITGGNNISRINPNGTIKSFSGGGGLGITYDGVNMWTINGGNGVTLCNVTKIAPDGSMNTYSLDVISCNGIVFDGANLWVTGIQNGGNYNFTAVKITTSGTFTDYISNIGFAFGQVNPLVFDGTYIWNFATKISTSGVITAGQNQVTCSITSNPLTSMTFDGTNVWGIAGSNGCGTLIERINQNQTVNQFTINEFNSNGGGGIFYDKTVNKLFASKDDEQLSCSPNCFLDTWAELNLDGTLNSSIAITSTVFQYTDILVNYDPLYLINNTWSYTFANNGNYTWNVKAYDALGGSNISLNNTIIVNFTAPIFNITGTVPDLNMSFNQVKSVIFDNQHYFQGATSYILTVINPDTNQSINISASNPSLLTSKYLVQILIGNNNVTTFQFTSYSQNYTGQVTPIGCLNGNCLNGTAFYLRISQSQAASTNFADTGSNYLLGILPPANTLTFTEKLSYSGIILFLLDIALLVAAALAGMMGGDSAKSVLAVIGIIDAAVIIGLIAIDYIPFVLVVGIIIIGLVIIGLIKRRG